LLSGENVTEVAIQLIYTFSKLFNTTAANKKK